MAISLTDGLRSGVRQGVRLSVAARSAAGSFDAAAAAYIAAVEAADGQALEAGVKTAINTFVVGCKADGIWNAIKASCILAGARTLSGALVPLAGTAPTNFNFVSGDYNRKTGLVGDGSTKYLDSNRNNNADPLNNFHFCARATVGGFSDGVLIGVNDNSNGYCFIQQTSNNARFLSKVAPASPADISNPGAVSLFYAMSRSGASTASAKTTAATASISTISSNNASINNFIYCRNNIGPSVPANYSNARLAFYSIGEALDLDLLDARVTTLISAYAAALP
jgi:hypothetical protein